jgi:phage terminase Nu1 subunit (DNA packaging protein)
MLTDGRKKTTAKTVTKAELAELFSVTRAAVSQWVRRRKLTAPALRPDGKIDVERARAQLAETIGYGRMASPEAAAARSAGAAEDAVASRLARARADLLSVRADERELSRAVAGVYVACDDAARPIARMMTDLIAAMESLVLRAPDLISSTIDDDQALARLRSAFDHMWVRVRGVDDRPRSGQAHPGAVSEVEAVEDSTTARAEGPAHAPARRREDEAARLARMRCEKAEAAAADALRDFQQRLGQYIDAEVWQATVAAGFRAIRAQIERELPSLAAAVRAAGDARRGTIVAMTWRRDVRRVLVSRRDEGTTK